MVSSLLPVLVFPERAIQIQLMSGVVYAGCVQGDGYCSLRTSLCHAVVAHNLLRLCCITLTTGNAFSFYTQEAHQPGADPRFPGYSASAPYLLPRLRYRRILQPVSEHVPSACLPCRVPDDYISDATASAIHRLAGCHFSALHGRTHRAFLPDCRSHVGSRYDGPASPFSGLTRGQLMTSLLPT